MTKDNHAVHQIDGPRTVVRHVRCTNPVLPTLPVYYDPSTPDTVPCIECGEAVEFANRSDPNYQLWFQDHELRRAAWTLLEGDGWSIERNDKGVQYAVKGASRRMIVVHSRPPLPPIRSVAECSWGRFPTIQVVPYSEAHYSDFKTREDVLAERGVPVLWVEDGRVVHSWNYPPK